MNQTTTESEYGHNALRGALFSGRSHLKATELMHLPSSMGQVDMEARVGIEPTPLAETLALQASTLPVRHHAYKFGVPGRIRTFDVLTDPD